MGDTRRDFLKLATALGCSSRLCGAEGWDQAPAILARIKAPVFPKRDFDITRYGAVADGQKDCTDAIANAIAAANQAAGGRVVVLAGTFLTGPVHLKSNVELHIAEGATLRFLRDPRRYLPLVYTRWEGVECMNYSPFVYSYGADNIGITGSGVVDGNSDCEHWWPWKGRAECGWTKGQPKQDEGRNLLFKWGAEDVPLKDRKLGEGYYLRPSFIQPVRARNVLIEDITILNSPMFEINPLLSTNVTVRNVKINSHGPNNDGCDPDSSTDVLIEKCTLDTGDDCIAIKSGRNRDGRRVARPTENVIIRNCRMKDGHGGVAIGSEMSGGVRNVFVENCQMDSPHLDHAFRLKTNAMRGGAIENVFFRDVQIGEVAHSVLLIDFYYEEGPSGPERPLVRNIDLRNATCRHAEYGLNLRGFPNAEIQNVHVERCTFERVDNPNIVENVEGLRQVDVVMNGKRSDA